MLLLLYNDEKIHSQTEIIMNINDYKASLKGAHVTVVGLGVSNIPLIDLLLDAGAIVTGRDRKPSGVFPLENELEDKGVRLILGEDYLAGEFDPLVFRSPGIRPDIPEFENAKSNGSIITSEMELFFDVCPCPVFAVTGSDGKTTTTTVSELMLRQGKRTFLGGNIGKPLIGEAERMTSEDVAVVELSSFQLQSMKRSPKFAAVTNITPNHLNWHRDMSEYINAKANIFRYQDHGGRLVLNYENEITRAFAKEARGEYIFFSSRREPDCENAVFLKDGTVIMRCKGKESELFETKSVVIVGMHNIENYMAAAALTHGYTVSGAVKNVATTFGGVEHRCQLVREKDGVRFYNSSIDSSPTRTLACLSSFECPVVIILGGYDKNLDYTPLSDELYKKARAVVCTGAAMEKIYSQTVKSVSGGPVFVKEPDFDAAVRRAASLACAGDAVVLSPACASFDAFANFEQRGRHFVSLVESI